MAIKSSPAAMSAPLWILLALLVSVRSCLADFTTTFDAVVAGLALQLNWDATDQSANPLIVGVSMINETVDAYGQHSVFGQKANISSKPMRCSRSLFVLKCLTGV
jgi:hypothetical protein